MYLLTKLFTQQLIKVTYKIAINKCISIICKLYFITIYYLHYNRKSSYRHFTFNSWSHKTIFILKNYNCLFTAYYI